jgi:hypothetical protein
MKKMWLILLIIILMTIGFYFNTFIFSEPKSQLVNSEHEKIHTDQLQYPVDNQNSNSTEESLSADFQSPKSNDKFELVQEGLLHLLDLGDIDGVHDYFSKWLEADPENAIAYLMYERNKALWNIIGPIGLENTLQADPQLSLALIHFDNTQFSLLQRYAYDVYDALAGVDPVLAINELNSNPLLANVEAAQIRVLMIWSMTDPDAAFVFLNDNVHLKSHGNIQSVIIENLIQRAPNIAKAHIREFPPGALKNQAQVMYAQILSQHNPNEALAWAASIESKSERSLAQHGALSYLSETNPESAIELIETQTQLEDDAKSDIKLHAVNAILKRDGESIVDNIDQYPLSAQASIATALASEMSQKTPERTLEWINDLPSGVLKDAVLSGHINSQFNFDSSALAPLISEVGNVNLRQNLFVDWLHISNLDNTKAAEQLLDQVDTLTSEDKKQILSRFNG